MPLEVKHPSKAHLSAVALGMLNAGDASKVNRHVAACDTCSQFINETTEIDKMAILVRANPKLADELRERTQLAKSKLKKQPSVAEMPNDLRTQSKYAIRRLIGSGGMGDVYEAEHVVMGRPVALKVMRQEFTNHPKALQLFRNEVRAVARLDHPNIVRAYDAETIGSLEVFVMELIDGDTTQELVRKAGGPLAIDQACRCIYDACIGLQHAHEKGLAHRDIKPSNLIADRTTGQTRLLDFGLVHPQRLESSTHQRTNGGTIGTFEYIAPEQAIDANNVDCRADIYSLGCTLYYLLTARLPFEQDNPQRLLLAHQTQIATPVSEIRSETPESLSRIVQQFMSKKPSDRPSTPREAAQLLSPYLSALPKELSDAELLRLAIQPKSFKANSLRRSPKRRLKIALGMAPFVLAALLLVMLRTSTGTIVLEGIPPNAEITVDGQSITATHDGSKLILREIETGSHRIAVSLDGRTIVTNDARVQFAGQQVTIRFDPLELVGTRPRPTPRDPGVESQPKIPAEATLDLATLAPDAADGPVDLLSGVRIPGDVYSGTWRWGEGKPKRLIGAPTPTHARMRFPLSVPPEYDVDFTFQPTNGVEAVMLNLPIAGKRVAMHFGAGHGEPWRIHSNLVVEDDNVAPFHDEKLVMENGKTYETHVEVRRRYVRVTVNGKLAMCLPTDYSKPYMWGGWLVGENCIGVISWRDVEITRLQVSPANEVGAPSLDETPQEADGLTCKVTKLEFDSGFDADQLILTGEAELAERGLELGVFNTSSAATKQVFRYPLRAEFKVHCEAPQLWDIGPGIFSSQPWCGLSLHYGHWANRKTFVHNFGKMTELPHNKIVPNRTYEVSMVADKDRNLSVAIDDAVIFREQASAEATLEGPACLCGGWGHVIYKSLTIAEYPPSYAASTVHTRFDDLNSLAWDAAVKANGDQASYLLACQRAIAAFELDPCAEHQGTLGLAFYRRGKVMLAYGALQDADRKLEGQASNLDQAELACLAMSAFRLDKKGEASQYLQRAKEVEDSDEEAEYAVVKEAVAMIEPSKP